MDESFWHQKWEENKIAFHKSEAHSLLLKYFRDLSLKKGSRIFLPLCGKTLDIAWLLSKGYRIAGAELSKMAIEQLFKELDLTPELSVAGELKHYSAKNIDIFVGDFFHLSGKVLGPVDAIYDRAALVALPEKMRNQYTTHLIKITDNAPQLLICFEYDQSLMEGPPFSVDSEEVNRHYGDSYDLNKVTIEAVSGGLKGLSAVRECVWLLKIINKRTFQAF